MKSAKLPFIVQALLAAIFFGASAPLSKLLWGDVPPVLMAALLYLGSGTGLTLMKALQKQKAETSLGRADLPWLAGAIIAGGVAAPIVLMFSLKNTPASTASLLLNFEGVGTTLIALLAFKEAIGGRAWGAILAITLASIALSTDFTKGVAGWGFSPGALGVIGACMLWGLDNNFTRNISDKDPLAIVAWKGLLAGAFSLLLGWLLGNQFPSWLTIVVIMLMGFVCYGLSTMLFIQSMRGLGAARTSALYGTAPLAGVILSIFMFGEIPSVLFGVAALLAIGGALLLINEKHTHFHDHAPLVHDHRHDHSDPAHAHPHETDIGAHAERHEHPAEAHEHDHSPDIHHRHGHDQS